MPKADKIDKEKVKDLARAFWNNSEIAAFFDVSESTITHNFQEIISKARETGKGRLKHAQLKAALNGNVTMLIWLGKQYLGQSEKISVESEELVKAKIELINLDGDKDYKKGRYKQYLQN